MGYTTQRLRRELKEDEFAALRTVGIGTLSRVRSAGVTTIARLREVLASPNPRHVLPIDEGEVATLRAALAKMNGGMSA